MTTRDFMFVNGTCGPTRPHVWKSDGGRRCPHLDEGQGDGDCYCAARAPSGHASQTVYRCACCGQYDYGEPGGPAFAECAAAEAWAVMT